jgi:hypothetical protein
VNVGTGKPMGAGGAQHAINSALGVSDTGKPNYDVTSGVGNTDVIGVSGSIASTATLKWKHQLNGDGFLAKSEMTRQTTAKSGPFAAMASVFDAALQERLDIGREAFEADPKLLEKDPKTLGADDRKKFVDATLARDVALLMGAMTAADQIVVTYALKPEKQTEANALLARAKQLRREKCDLQAEKLLDQAGKILEDDVSYQASKVSLLGVKTDKRENVVVNARFIQFGQFVDGKFEHPAMVLNVPPKEA